MWMSAFDLKRTFIRHHGATEVTRLFAESNEPASRFLRLAIQKSSPARGVGMFTESLGHTPSQHRGETPFFQFLFWETTVLSVVERWNDFQLMFKVKSPRASASTSMLLAGPVRMMPI